MQVVVHYPKSADARKALSRNLAEIHAHSVIRRIKEMNLSEDDTKKLINMICDRAKNTACIHS